MVTHPYTLLPCSTEHTHTIVLLHPHDRFAPAFGSDILVTQASDGRTLRELFPSWKWIFPAATTKYCPLANAQRPLWFQRWSAGIPPPTLVEIEGLAESIREILFIIRKEAKLVPLKRIILGGVSHGCVTAMFAMLFGGTKLGGFVGYGGWLPNRNKFLEIVENKGTIMVDEILMVGELRKMLLLDSPRQDIERLGYNPMSLMDLSLEPLLEHRLTHTPVFMAHSKQDIVAPVDLGQEAYSALRTIGFLAVWKRYQGGGNWIKEPQRVDDLVNFLRKRQ
ncbi:hypothetical protein VTL71DRAFT_7141 [Oculimacula yallundae]|uniref:Phospholipase/carboxylesterase/thioesterase domain-containing protein n=1 Tax=Oculimacula yallundae TaxID=86028 RepID=A0ABR4BYG3_9HELO